MAEIIGMYTAIQNRLIEDYGITLCDGYTPDEYMCCENYGNKPHVCVYYNPATKENKRIGNWRQENTVESTFILLYEIGHTIRCYETEIIDEYSAYVFAIRKCGELGINLSRDLVVEKQRELLALYRRNEHNYSGTYVLSDTDKPDWVTIPEDYSIVSVYDKVFDVNLQDCVNKKLYGVKC